MERKTEIQKISIAVLIIVLFKISAYFYHGIGLENDSYAYLKFLLHPEFPPLYPYFLKLFVGIENKGFWIILSQSLLFATATVYFLKEHAKHLTIVHWSVFAIVIGIDPITSYFCRAIMSESLFISLLVIWISFFWKTNKWHQFILLGILSGILYTTRFATLGIIIPILTIYTILNGFNKKKWINLSLVFIGFQLFLLPVRWQYMENFNSPSINGFSGAVLWNNTTHLYESSNQHNNPFEIYLSTKEFNQDVQHSLNGDQLWDYDFPYRDYQKLHQISPGELFEHSNMAGKTAFRTIIKHPFRYLAFVYQNFMQIYISNEIIEAKKYKHSFKEHFEIKNSPKHTYLAFTALISLLVLFICAIVYRKNKHILSVSLGLIAYLFLIPFIGINAIRLTIICLPICYLLIFSQIKKELIKN